MRRLRRLAVAVALLLSVALSEGDVRPVDDSF